MRRSLASRGVLARREGVPRRVVRGSRPQQQLSGAEVCLGDPGVMCRGGVVSRAQFKPCPGAGEACTEANVGAKCAANEATGEIGEKEQEEGD